MYGPSLLTADRSGKISVHTSLEGSGMKAGIHFTLATDELIKLPPGSRLYVLKDRAAIGYDRESGDFATLAHMPVAAFIAPGYTATYSASYTAGSGLKPLPLFSYAACVHYRKCIHVAAVRVDRERRHDSRFIDMVKVRSNIRLVRKLFPRNRLARHLEKCALYYGCPGGQNFFLGRYEGPLPTSPVCNARCLGCISYQPKGKCHVTQPRIEFIPTAEEVCEIALFSIKGIKDPVVSFGQGCEGEPLTNPGLLERSIRLIRKSTSKGVININTNASSPHAIARLFDSGLNSIRVSINSVQPEYYSRYYKPAGYSFRDVIQSIKAAKSRKGFVSINYLTMPGLTDSKNEFAAFRGFIGSYGIDMVQWRNLNYDPILYFSQLRFKAGARDMLGVRQVISGLKKSFPKLMTGYFNPGKGKIASNLPLAVSPRR